MVVSYIKCKHMFLLLIWLLQVVNPHLIISIVSSNPEVSANQIVNITILTTQVITQGGLAITFPPDFAVAAPCRVNSTDSSCLYETSTTAAKITFSSISFATGTYYALSVIVTNPVYATNFQVSASASGTVFSNTGLLTVNPKTIACSMTASSGYVGDTAPATLTLTNSALPANSLIVISSPLQTTFNNLFASSPICSTSAGPLSCSVSTSFGQQYLTISSIPSTTALLLTINSINNAPYNGSLIAGNLQIKNQNSYDMQICSFSQPAPTMLRASIGASLTNWNSTVGAVSNVTLTIDTYFTPFTTKILWVYDPQFTITLLSPASTTSFAIAGSSVSNYISGGVAAGKTLSFLATITNPTSQLPLLFSVYIIYSNTLFIENYQISNYKLTTLAMTIAVSLGSSRTMTVTTYNVSTNIGFTQEGNPVVNVSLKYGTVQCSALSLTSNAGFTVGSCTDSTLVLTAVSINQGSVWMSFRVLNYFSVRSDNSITVSLTSSSPTYYSIGSGSTPLSLSINTSPLTILNSVTTFATATSFTITEPSVTLSSTNARIVTITAPSDLQLNVSTLVSSNSAQTSVDNFTISSNVLTILVRGTLNMVVSGVANPKKYMGSITWNCKSSDLEANPASESLTDQSPFYTPASTSVTLSFSDPKIETTSNLTLTIIPVLQYSNPPNVTITLSTELILTPCVSCYLLSSNSLTFSYSATIMTVTFQVNNSLNPTGNSLKLEIAGGGVIFQQKDVSFNLQPMAFGYVSSQLGFFGQLGTVNITITKTPSTPIVLVYSGLDSIISSFTCVNCTNNYLIATGIVQYFQTSQVTLTGTSNGVTYATVKATVYYVCSSIQGCRICSSSTGVLQCQMCFNSSYTTYNLLYKSQCLSICPYATYANGVTCLDCPMNCQSCTTNACELCYIGFYVYNGSCLDACPEPLINNGTHCIPVPIICPSHCANCPLNNRCSACEGGYYLLNDTCYSTCPSSYYPDTSGTGCLLFIPPQQAKYFPFAFVISAVLLTIVLLSIKCYQKRSLVMGNLIALLSIVQIGSMIMTLTYTFRLQQKDLLTQSLIFILLLSKILLNVIFLIYFLKAIVDEQDFQNWREGDESHERLYKVLIAMSSLLSFQCIRIIYSRLMGLRMFFGKFNTSLIFKPLNYFTAAHFFTSGFALVFLSVRNIIAQNGYKTSIFYSSLESIILEFVLLICCVIDNKKGYDDQFFQYQVYKVKNQYQSSHIEPVEIEEQAENAGSMHQIMSVVQPSSTPRNDRSSLIVKNSMWVPRGRQMKDMEVQHQEEKEEEQDQGGVVTNKKESLFRRRIIDDWRQLQKTLPSHISHIRRYIPKKKGVQNKKANLNQSLKRSSSVQQIEVRLPEVGSLPQRIKQYFYNLNTNPQHPIERTAKKSQRKLNKDSKLVIQDEPKSVSMEVERDFNSAGEDLELDSYEPKGDDRTTEDINIFMQEPIDIHSNFGYRPEIDQLEEQEEEEEENGVSELNDKDKRQYQSNQKLKNQKMLVDYPYEEGEEKEKRYKTKKRRVNRQTQEVYLQRLVGSSDRKNRPQKTRKIEF